MKKVLLYPGAFNPPHYGHVATIEIALGKIPFDEVWIVPSGRREDKTISTNYENRRKLNELFVEYLCSKLSIPVKLITAELDNTDGKFTHEILREIKSQKDIEITQLIGLDGFLNLQAKLTNPREKFIVVKRSGYVLSSDLISRDNILILEEGTDSTFQSSTKIRQMAELHDPEFKKFVPDKIAEYIDEKNLYL